VSIREIREIRGSIPLVAAGRQRVTKGSGMTNGVFLLKPGIRNCNYGGTLKMADLFGQTFTPELHVAKQLGREIFRPQLACQGKSGNLKSGNWERLNRRERREQRRENENLCFLCFLCKEALVDLQRVAAFLNCLPCLDAPRESRPDSARNRRFPPLETDCATPNTSASPPHRLNHSGIPRKH